MHPAEDKPNHPEQADWPRLARYFAGELSPREVGEVDAWIAADPARRSMMASLSSAWKSAARRTHGQTSDVDAAWLKMAARLDAAGAPVALDSRASSGPAYTRSAGVRTALRVAAALVVLVGGAVLWRAARRDAVGGAAPATQERTFVTAPGERRTITLDDNSEVVLGVASRVVVAAGYGASARELTLEGEALFRVRHEPAHPFRVRTAHVVTEDLGTEFAVRSYRTVADGDTVRVVVTSGSVALRRDDAPNRAESVVRAGQSAVVGALGAPTVTQTTNAAALVAFARGELVFDDAPMQRVADELGRWYDVDVELASPALAARHLTASFAHESLDDVLRVVALSIGARFEHRGRTVAFRPSGP